jgi:DNA-binding protein YbaB
VTSGGGFDLEELLESVQKFQQDVAGSTQRLAVEVADAWSKDHLVHVWVNAQGIVIDAQLDDTEFSSATAESVAEAMVQAAQAAAATMREKVAAFQADLQQRLAGLAPAAATGLPDVAALRSVQPAIPTSPPGARDRQENTTSTPEKPMDPHAGEAGGWDFTLRG